MANEEHVARLKQGVEAWNAWRIIPHIDGASYTEANLSGATLRDAQLVKADLIGAKLGVADLREANLCTTNLSKANLSGANLGTALLRRHPNLLLPRDDWVAGVVRLELRNLSGHKSV